MLLTERRENLFEERREVEVGRSGLCCCWGLQGRAWVSIVVDVGLGRRVWFSDGVVLDSLDVRFNCSSSTL